MKRFSIAGLACILAACQPSGTSDNPAQSDDPSSASKPGSELCESPATPIAEVQGEGFVSPLEGELVTVRGVVTQIPGSNGLFIQEERPTSFASASHGLFVDFGDLAAQASRRELLSITGLVREIGQADDTLTAIGEISDFAICGEGAEPPDIDARLPLSPLEREAFEGMRVLLEQPLTVTAARDVSRGLITVSALGLLKAPTEAALPGEEALAWQRKNHDWSIQVHSEGLRSLEPYTDMHAGAIIHMVSGVIGHDGRQLTLLAADKIDHISLPLPEIEPAGEDSIRVLSYNLHEYFNGDGKGGGFPGERGAESLREFERQASRIHAAVEVIRPDILAVMEIENDGFGPQSAVEHLRESVSAALGVQFATATPGSSLVGTDVISVGLLFRSDRLQAVGPAHTLEGGDFGPLNRVPLAQVFRDRSSGTEFLVAVNHLKSKGYCPDSGINTDQGDGQACWNAARVGGARQTVAWAKELAGNAGTDAFLLVGDFNAYRKEDPVRAIEEAGLVELVAHHQPGLPQYSYIYLGAAGTLDYAFASPSLAATSIDAFIWHINAAYPWSSRPSAAWLHSSDHDPVVVDLSFSQASTSD